MRSKKKGIPSKYQIPAAIGLAVVFGTILIWRFGGSEEDAAAATEIPGAPQRVSIEGLNAVLSEIETGNIGRSAVLSTSPPLERDPFQRIETIVETATEPSEEKVQEEMEESREDRLMLLRLSGTCIIGSTAMAVINGKYYKPGDEIDGFYVKDIKPSEVVLEDEIGPEVLRIQEVSEL